MAGRPTVRTAVVSAETRELLAEIFGGAANAYRNLRLSEDVTYVVFQRAMHGKTVTPGVVVAIERGWGRWSARLVTRVHTGEYGAVREA